MKTPVVIGRLYYRSTGTQSTSLVHVLQKVNFLLIDFSNVNFKNLFSLLILLSLLLILSFFMQRMV